MSVGTFDNPNVHFSHIHINTICPLPMCQGYQFPLVIVGHFSHWQTAIPIKDTSANTVSKAVLREWIVIFSMPQVITTDREEGHNFSHPYLKSLSTYLGGKRHSYDSLQPMHKRSCGEISLTSKNFPSYQARYLPLGRRSSFDSSFIEEHSQRRFGLNSNLTHLRYTFFSAETIFFFHHRSNPNNSFHSENG